MKRSERNSFKQVTIKGKGKVGGQVTWHIKVSPPRIVKSGRQG